MAGGMQLVTPGLVLREVKIGEADRILTVLTPELGLISVSAKGSLRLKSKLFSACGLFCYSEFTLFAGKNLYLANDAQVKKVFFGLHESVEAMALAMYLAEVAMVLSPVGAEADALLRLTLNSLYLISEGQKSLQQIKAVFELRAVCEAGFLPDLLYCHDCQTYDGGDFFFATTDGLLLCPGCAAKRNTTPHLDPAALLALRHIALVEDKKIFGFAIPPKSMEALGRVTERYALQTLDKPLKTLDFVHTMLR